jgi:hypothetical protein
MSVGCAKLRGSLELIENTEKGTYMLGGTATRASGHSDVGSCETGTSDV